MLQTTSFWISRWIWSMWREWNWFKKVKRNHTDLSTHITIFEYAHIFCWSGQTKVNRPTGKKDNHKTYEQNAKQKAMLMLMCSYFIRCIFFVSVCFTSRSNTWIYTLFSGYSTKQNKKIENIQRNANLYIKEHICSQSSAGRIMFGNEEDKNI